MTDFLKNWVTNIVTLVMVIILLEILVPSGRMKKYISLVTGIILVIAMINPFTGLFGKGVNLAEFQLVNSNTIDKKEIEKSSKMLEESQMKQIVEVYRKKLITQIENAVRKEKGSVSATADVIINEDYESDDFGRIKRVYIYLNSPEEAVKPVEAVRKVEKISVGGDPKPAEQEEMQGSSVDPLVRRKLEDKLSVLFGIDREAIVISQEGSR